MDLARRVSVLSVAEAVVLAVFVADVVVRWTWPDGWTGPGRVLVIGAAAAVAVVCYQTWSTAEQRSIRLHAAAASALVGGACIAAAATTPADDAVLGSVAFGAVGTAGVVLAVVSLQLESFARRRDVQP